MEPDLVRSMALHAQACERFCTLGETVLKLAAEGKWGELVEVTADALNNADAVEEGDEELYEAAKAQARYANSRRETYEIAKQLVVRPGDIPDQLVVDCGAVMEDENDIGLWWIEFRDDQWHHWPSDGHSSLFEALYAISARRRAKHAAARSVNRPAPHTRYHWVPTLARSWWSRSRSDDSQQTQPTDP